MYFEFTNKTKICAGKGSLDQLEFECLQHNMKHPLILTDDGDFVYKVTHPKHEITKTYTVTLSGIIENQAVEKLREGVEIEDYTTRPAKVKILKTDSEKNISRIEITIHEGKNRQVRKMCEAIGRNVMALHRSKIGNIGVKDLKIGEWRYLSSTEIKSIIIV